jgi:hypothetical protein
MAKGRQLSASHKAAISAGMKRYWAEHRKSSGGSAAQKRLSNTSTHLETGKQISRADSAAIMFGSAGAAKRIRKATKGRTRRK